MSKVTYKGPFRPGALASDPAGLLPGKYCPYDGTVDVPVAWLPSLLAGDWIAADAEAETYVPPAPEFYEEVYVSQSDGRLVDEERVDIFDPDSVATKAQSRLSLAANLDALIVGAITRDGNGAATSAGVVWPDGSTGTYTATTVSTAFPGAVDAYTVTYVPASGPTLTYTQPAVTRDSSTGAVTARPAITVA